MCRHNTSFIYFLRMFWNGVDMLNENIVVDFCSNIASGEYNNRVILSNPVIGTTMKLSKECYELLVELISKESSLSDFFCMYSDEDKEYMYKLIDLLLSRKILIDKNDEIMIKEEKKKKITLKLTDRCNLKCIHCSISCSADSEKKELSTDEWKRVIDKLDPGYVSEIVITGGEAMYRKDFFEIAEYAREKINVYMTLMSNATLITEENAERLLNIFDDFSFSIDGADEESCSKVRGKGVFDRIINNINIMKAKGMQQYSVSFTELNVNKDKKDKFIELAKKMGAEPMIRRFDPDGRGKDNKDILEVEDIQDRFDPVNYLSDEQLKCEKCSPNMLPHSFSCAAIYKELSIFENGDIHPCLLLDMPTMCLGNIKDIESFEEYFIKGKVYESEGYKNFIELHPCFNEECKMCPAKFFCDTCLREIHRLNTMENKKEICEKKVKVYKRMWN